MANANNEDAVVPNGHSSDQGEDLIDLHSISDISLYPQTPSVDRADHEPMLTNPPSVQNDDLRSGDRQESNTNSTLEREREIQRKYLTQLETKLTALNSRVDTIEERLTDLEYLEIRLKARRPIITQSEPEKSNKPKVNVTSDEACPETSGRESVHTSRGL